MIVLKVPYSEKDQAKALGARWNSERKVWYVPEGQAAAPFERWLTSEVLDRAAPAAGKKPAKVDSYAGKPVTGKHYIELEHDCNPFVACPQCRATLDDSGWNAAYRQVTQMLEAIRLAR